jgi:hypothetical protein
LNNNNLVFNLRGSYNWNVIFEQLHYKVVNFHKNLFCYHTYLPLQYKRNYSLFRFRKLYQFGFRHAIYKVLKRKKVYVYKHFYLLKKPFKRYKRLNGF